jgi:hypothetical protein
MVFTGWSGVVHCHKRKLIITFLNFFCFFTASCPLYFLLKMNFLERQPALQPVFFYAGWHSFWLSYPHTLNLEDGALSTNR